MGGPTPDIATEFEFDFVPSAPSMMQRVGGKGHRGPVVHDRSVTWRATRTAKGPATIAIGHSGHRVSASAWGPGADIAIEQIPDLLGASDRPEGLVPKDPLVARLMALRPDMRMTRTNSIWEHLIHTILGQKVPVASASSSWQQMLRRWGETPPGPESDALVLGPDPDVIADLAYHDLHLVNVERQRADVILTCAKRWRRLEEALTMTPVDARRRLEAIRGIGPWTSSIVTQLAFGDPDAVIVGDYNIPALVSWNFAGERTADDARMLELLEPYVGQRARVQNLIKFGGRKPPRHGPRLSVVDLAGR